MLKPKSYLKCDWKGSKFNKFTPKGFYKNARIMKLRIASKFWKGKSYQLLGTKFLLLGILASILVGSCQSLIVSYQLMGAKFKFVGNNLATEIVLQIPRIGTQMPVSRITGQRLLAGFQSLVLVSGIIIGTHLHGIQL